MEKILHLIKADDFNLAMTNLLIDLYSREYLQVFEELWFDPAKIAEMAPDELDRLTKVAAVIEYVGNRRPDVHIYEWVHSHQLKLKEPYTPGVEEGSFERMRRIFSAPKEFSTRNVFYDEKTLKPV